ncbi:hypothetical protein O9G_000609 [Rozella allomycis CSF55]|uniref:Uncharacterized protein n=1 Tax=Rozella allomycis (strain CSF55) TaxID=988480 RepID=A0A075AW88_ROZAC|nr:hypothetical protein O9G_000609 [Rozella allomycis CSF55]|eukprot:EPZ34422.1 hypothetical protein O9G_000609 [Rozella allomycis CSF55]
MASKRSMASKRGVKNPKKRVVDFEPSSSGNDTTLASNREFTIDQQSRFQKKKSEMQKTMGNELEKTFSNAILSIERQCQNQEKTLDERLGNLKDKLTELEKDRENQLMLLKDAIDNFKTSNDKMIKDLEENQSHIVGAINEFIKDVTDIKNFQREECDLIRESIEKEFTTTIRQIRNKANDNPMSTIK